MQIQVIRGMVVRTAQGFDSMKDWGHYINLK